MHTSPDLIFENNINIEIEDDVYVNSGMIEVLTDLNKDFKFIKIFYTDNSKYLHYQVNFIIGHPIDVIVNAKRNIIEFMYPCSMSVKIDPESVHHVLSIMNRRMEVSRAVYHSVNRFYLNTNYRGVFSKETFAEFVDLFIKDAYNTHLCMCDFEILIEENRLRLQGNVKVKKIINFKKNSDPKRKEVIKDMKKIVKKFYNKKIN